MSNSPSIWAGWYRGVFTDYKSISEQEMQKVKHFLHVEWGGDSHARRHSEDAFYNLKNIEAGKGGDERAGDAPCMVAFHVLRAMAIGRKVMWSV